MDASTIFLAALILHVSLSQFHRTQDVVLLGSVFQTFRRTTLQQCRRLCVYSSRCLSVNWSPSTRECQLNSKKGDVESLQVSRSNIYLPAEQITEQGHPCANQPCSANHMCIPVNAAKAHVCVRVGASMPQTTEAGIINSATTTTTRTTVATIAPQAASATTSTTIPTAPKLTTTTSTTAATTTPTTTTTPTASTTPATTTTTPATTTTVTTTTLPNTSPATTTSISTSTATTSPEPTTSISQAQPTTTTTTTTPKPYNGTCVTDIDCAVPPGRTCSSGVCICSIGYDMDESSVTCRKLTDCASFGSEFTVYTDTAIGGNNVKVISSQTPAGCAKLCVGAEDIVCRSFETYYNNCFLQILTWFDVSDSNRGTLQGADHYQRRCNW